MARRRPAPKFGYAPKEWDIFISHAWEDKDTIARPLAHALQEVGISVWYDEFTLKLGDSLNKSINNGLAKSKFGIVIISKHFLNKKWTQKELAGLVAREDGKKKIILPIWHEITVQEIMYYSPILADRIAVSSSVGIPEVVRQLVRATNLGYIENNVVGFWHGASGRMRLYPTGKGKMVEGDYDWNGFLWAGHLKGGVKNGVFLFDWYWDKSLEKGRGMLVLDPVRNVLTGGWSFETVTHNNAIQNQHPWSFVPLTVNYNDYNKTSYDEHLKSIGINSSLDYVCQQAGKIYDEMFKLNCILGIWSDFYKFDHTLLFYIAGYIKTHVRIKEIKKMTENELAELITERILEYLNDPNRMNNMFDK